MNEQSMVLMQKMQESPALVPEAFQVCDSLQKFRDPNISGYIACYYCQQPRCRRS